MQNLINIEQNHINNNVARTVNARELHAFLESKQDFSTWIKKRISDYGFTENIDFIRFHKKMEANNASVIDYHITLDMAKELSMVERNEKGKQARQYFIACEKTANVIKITPLIDNGLPEYRKAKAQQLSAQAFKTAVESMEYLFNLMPHLSDVSRQCAAAHIVNPLLGRVAIPLPTVNERYLSAREVGDMLGVSAHQIGRTANEHQLKTDAYGKVFMDKSPYSSKQVESFRYNAEGVKALRGLIHGKAVS